ncbi:xenobiotic compound monooxygenase, partial [Pseudohyphozyma bogoriensis]
MPFAVESIADPQNNGVAQTTGPWPKRKLILNAFDMFAPSHIAPGTWTGESEGHRFDDLEYWLETAKLLERGKFHGIFLADSYGTYDVYQKKTDASFRAGFQFPKLDPLLIVSAMASVTTNLAFGVTSSTT